MQCAFAQAESQALFLAHGWRWAGLYSEPPAWKLTATELFPCFERGLMIRLRFQSYSVARIAKLRELLALEPITEIAVEVGAVGHYDTVAIRTLLPHRHSIHLTVIRHGTWAVGRQDAFIASLLSSPVMTSASKLVLDGMNHRSGLPVWLAKSPFLYSLQSLSMKGCGLTDIEARELARAANLGKLTQLDVTGNVIGEVGRAALTARFGSALML